MVQKRAITEEIEQGKESDGKYHIKYHIILHTSLHWVVDSRANAEFSIFVINFYLTLVCTFFAPFTPSKFGVNQIFYAVFLLITHS